MRQVAGFRLADFAKQDTLSQHYDRDAFMSEPGAFLSSGSQDLIRISVSSRLVAAWLTLVEDPFQGHRFFGSRDGPQVTKADTVKHCL